MSKFVPGGRTGGPAYRLERRSWLGVRVPPCSACHADGERGRRRCGRPRVRTGASKPRRHDVFACSRARVAAGAAGEPLRIPEQRAREAGIRQRVLPARHGELLVVSSGFGRHRSREMRAQWTCYSLGWVAMRRIGSTPSSGSVRVRGASVAKGGGRLPLLASGTGRGAAPAAGCREQARLQLRDPVFG